MKILVTAALAAFVLGAAPSVADPGFCPPGLAKKGACGGRDAVILVDGRGQKEGRGSDKRYKQDRGGDERYDRGDRRDDGDRHRSRDRHDDRDYRDRRRYGEYRDRRDHYYYGRGDVIHRHYVVVRDWDRRGWRRPPRGYSYVVVGDEAYLIAEATKLIVGVLLYHDR
jgi:Ni/Co efflux regulator RcnB